MVSGACVKGLWSSCFFLCFLEHAKAQKLMTCFDVRKYKGMSF